MEKSNPNISKGPAWQLIGEFLPSGENGSQARAREWIVRLLRNLGLNDNQVAAIGRDVGESLNNAIQKMDQTVVWPQVPVRVWVPDPRTPSSNRPKASPGAQPENPAWGFFLTTKAGLPDQGKISFSVDLFLYYEGEGHT